MTEKSLKFVFLRYCLYLSFFKFCLFKESRIWLIELLWIKKTIELLPILHTILKLFLPIFVIFDPRMPLVALVDYP